MVDRLTHEVIRSTLGRGEKSYFNKILSDKQQFTSLLDGNYNRSGPGQLEEMERAIELLSDAVTVLLAIVVDRKLIDLGDLNFSLQEGHRIKTEEEESEESGGLKL